MMRDVVIAGSTGSIGTQALQVIDDHPGHFRVRGLACGGGSVDSFVAQIVRYRPDAAAVADEAAARRVSDTLADAGVATQVLAGADGVVEACGSFPDACVLNGITGAVGLRATLAALKSGATLALANKESLVAGGSLVTRAQQRPAQVVPVDSEHSAIAQALASGIHNRGMCATATTGESELAQIILTASGGPFRGKSRSDLAAVTPEQALNHPTWSMGPVVTINSSTLVNKALELIEAVLLFDVAPDQVQPVCHPQSIVHSAVTWRDGATIAQASPPDMKLPIALGLTWPRRLDTVSTPLDFTHAQLWEFEPIDADTFPAIEIARGCVAASATHPAVFNAANEVLVDAFLAGKLPYLAIVDTLGEITAAHDGIAEPSLDDIEAVQEWARLRAGEVVKGRG
ncbi:1-deoxy-D-xylulose-5-phosphate reductoisomerase [Nanchangia anserum]|uniref:1-deoxy-D-xylulose 5-phosphate reductoisomerase n=1 Tax=Nanchangia anserum TaxID=2692125 RepID=A0A8I0G8A0_9ACTO|nr:1-deoxy-D-xylulose-5-phosphate reductoisomerase [Nanchangia anserum]MBD3688979.1 1-deoxy-D-xylulose-5-phosphate reductoisomerase [Nanchangia anserum]QOX81231.1 1-deoxy-D-xylulose-5-phosphate reductoisomerase [Nanchangia anserum]